MHATFFQKVILTALAGFVAAGVIWGFRHVFEEANTAAGNYNANTTSLVVHHR